MGKTKLAIGLALLIAATVVLAAGFINGPGRVG